MKKFISLLSVCLIALNAFSKISLPSIIGNNMVLQQQTEVPLWGKAEVNSRISVKTSWNGRLYHTKADADGSWRIRVQTPAAGGPYEITLSDGENLKLTNVLIGEVWVCSGQSNMEMPVKGFGNQPILNSNDILMNAENPQLRLIRYERGLSRTPQYDCRSTSWEVSDARSAKEFSAAGYQFAQLLQQQLKIPVGIIMSTWGGTMIEAWMTQNSLKAFPEIKIPAVSDPAEIVKNDPTVLFNAMINPFLGYGIKGVIWYQGEQNRSNPQVYDKLMAAMVKEWRSLWKQGKWPFYYVQIAPYAYHDKLGPAAPLREAQLKAMKLIPNSGMVVSMDVGEETKIHPADKTTISKRLAYWALANDYEREGLAFASPVYQSMKIDKDKAYINFENTPNGLTAFGEELTAFEIAGADKVFHPAEAKISGNGVMVWSETVKNPKAVRYAYKDWVIGHLYNTEGLSASPFRTDSW